MQCCLRNRPGALTRIPPARPLPQAVPSPPTKGRQWEPGQLVNSVDHANTHPECLGAEFAHSTPPNGAKESMLSCRSPDFDLLNERADQDNHTRTPLPPHQLAQQHHHHHHHTHPGPRPTAISRGGHPAGFRLDIGRPRRMKRCVGHQTSLSQQPGRPPISGAEVAGPDPHAGWKHGPDRADSPQNATKLTQNSDSLHSKVLPSAPGDPLRRPPSRQ